MMNRSIRSNDQAAADHSMQIPEYLVAASAVIGAGLLAFLH